MSRKSIFDILDDIEFDLGFELKKPYVYLILFI